MTDQPDLVDTLRDVSALLHAARRSIAQNGHTQALLHIDKLIGMAERDTDHRLSSLVLQRFGSVSPGNAVVRHLSSQRN